MYGDPQLPAGFTHFAYVNPEAPKGGALRLAMTGSFDNLNPFIIKGERETLITKYVFESLMARNRDEPFALYGLIARSIDVNAERTRVTFHLDPRAKFSDGTPVTAEDVAFSHLTLRDHGRPNHRAYYAKVEQADVVDEHTITFHLQGGDRELVLILGLMPVLPRHYFADRDFTETTLEPLIGSGAYVIDEVRQGERLVLRRNPDHWARDLPVSRGLWNFERIVLDYYRDTQTAFEATKSHLGDLIQEYDPTRWATGYDFPAVKDGAFRKMTVPAAYPAPVSAFVFNTRRALFADARVREALVHVFDFEWANANLFHGLYQRTAGYFDGSPLSSVGRPVSDAETRIIDRLDIRLRRDFLDGSARPPVSDGSGRDRNNLRRALELLHEAGWKRAGNWLVHGQTGDPFEFELTVLSKDQERTGLHFQRSLRHIGIDMAVRNIDSAQFQRRLQAYDYDMIPFTWYNSLSPGNEQRFYWGSDGRTTEGTRNYMGAADPAIDAVIDELLKARDHDRFTAAVRLLDRVLRSGFYVLPLYHAPGQWIGHWSNVAFPDTPSLVGFLPETGWSVTE